MKIVGRDEVREKVLQRVLLGSCTFAEIHGFVGGGHRTYRAVDRAIQYHRKALRIRFDGRFWRA